MVVNDDLAQSLVEVVEARTGIRKPAVVTIHRGETLLRFASSDKPARWKASPWWIRQSTFDVLRDSWRRDREKPGWTARYHLAGAMKFDNRMDVVVRAFVNTDFNAYVGIGKPQRETAPNGIHVTWMGRPTLEQIYIPCLLVVMRDALAVVPEAWPVRSAQLW